ncbi:MAG TPA: ZIP family metal transporter [Bacillales bacterium]|nr:ZIP family metal transporter [Bacillales bacterium]
MWKINEMGIAMSWGLMGYVVLAAAANVAGGFIIFLKKDWSDRALHALMALSAGLLLAITLADLIPEVMKQSGFSPVYILISLAGMFLLQQWVEPHTHGHGEYQQEGRSKSTVTSLTIGMSIHTFFDGFSIIASFALDVRLGLTVLLAIFLHKIPDGVTISSVVFSFSRNKKKGLGSAVIMGVVTIAGGLAAWLLTEGGSAGGSTLVIALSISAGIFLYIANAELLPAIREAQDRLLPWFVAIGIAAYFLLDWLLGQLGTVML